MLKCHEQPSLRKINHVPADDEGDRDWVAYSVARRFGLSIPTARAVAELAGLGSNDDRATASGGRAK